MRLAAPIALALGLVLAPPRAVASCADGEFEQCLPIGCVCLPAATAEIAGVLLAQWLVLSRDQSAATAMPIPPAMRERLADWVDAEVLDAVRYKIGEHDVFNLADLNFDYGDVVGHRVMAMTLIDVIVFRDQQTAADDAVWAHELFHVMQFRDWGVQEFAMRYTQDSQEIEKAAYAFENTYRRRTRVK